MNAISCRADSSDRAARLPRRGPDARIVDQDDLALASERIGQGRIPVIQVAAEVLQHHKRQISGAPKTAVGELHARRLNDLRLCRVVGGWCPYGVHPRCLPLGLRSTSLLAAALS